MANEKVELFLKIIQVCEIVGADGTLYLKYVYEDKHDNLYSQSCFNEMVLDWWGLDLEVGDCVVVNAINTGLTDWIAPLRRNGILLSTTVIKRNVGRPGHEKNKSRE